VFKRATGWLGWSPEAALTTPIPQIELAFEGFIDCKIKTNPFGSGDSDGSQRQQKPPEPERVQQDIKSALRGMASARKAGRQPRRRSSEQQDAAQQSQNEE
jgi:hypothetical protein